MRLIALAILVFLSGCALTPCELCRDHVIAGHLETGEVVCGVQTRNGMRCVWPRHGGEAPYSTCYRFDEWDDESEYRQMLRKTGLPDTARFWCVDGTVVGSMKYDSQWHMEMREKLKHLGEGR